MSLGTEVKYTVCQNKQWLVSRSSTEPKTDWTLYNVFVELHERLKTSVA